VYPIKVNQQRHMVEEYVRFAYEYHMGLEAGSKPELLIVLAMLDDPDALIICNGYKDAEFIETALLAQKLGRKPIIVVEKFTEFKLLVELSQKHNIRPTIGVRAKLASKGSGKWESSAGDRAKFGLTVGEMVDGVAFLKQQGMLDCLQMMHFHIGSQINAIRSMKNARALGLAPGRVMRLVILPQALRVIIPPLTSQYLNLTKNSSLAIVIGYPDLVSIANTSINQTGQAIEAIAILMAVYLSISLAISLFMNWYNSRMRLAQR
jgi:hypothetical protein